MGIFNLVVFTTLLMLVGKNNVQGELGTSFSFNSFNYPRDTNLTYQGYAHVPQECKFLRLTKTNSSGVPGAWCIGRVLYSNPIVMSKANFDTTIKFTIAPSRDSVADGLAFFIAPVGTTIPSSIYSAGGNLGIYESSGVQPSFFSVEFDSYENTWDPGFRHIGINLYSRISYNVTKFDSATGEEVTARITYNARSSTVTVVATTCTQTATLTYVVNLSDLLSEHVQVGISSSSGNHGGVHDVHSWSFNSNKLIWSDNNANEIYNEDTPRSAQSM